MYRLYRPYQVVRARLSSLSIPEYKSIVTISDFSPIQTLDTLRINKTANIMSDSRVTVAITLNKNAQNDKLRIHCILGTKTNKQPQPQKQKVAC